MDIPPNFDTQKTINKVCKFKESLYGLKQSPISWFDEFNKIVKKYVYF